MKRPAIVPSILSADFANLERDVRRVQDAGAASVQFDVMDGHFVPNLTVGPDVVAAVRKGSSLYLDVHLMIEHPERYLEPFARAGANLLTVHWEACDHPLEAVRQIKSLKVHAGMAIRPRTPVEVLEPVLKELDLALVMTVEPGFGGQAFMPEMLPKVQWLHQKARSLNLHFEIQVDGGINRKTVSQAAAAGASSLVAGSAVYGAKDPVLAFRELQKLAEDAYPRS